MPHVATDAGSAEGQTTSDCSIAATLEVVGDRWTLLILRTIFRGRRRFGQIHEELGIARNLLTDRLTALVANGVLEKVPYQQRPPRYEYRLTTKGADLSPSLIALMGWGDRWYAMEGPPTILYHNECGHRLELNVRCPSCDAPIRPGQISSRPGPGSTRNESH